MPQIGVRLVPPPLVKGKYNKPHQAPNGVRVPRMLAYIQGDNPHYFSIVQKLLLADI